MVLVIPTGLEKQVRSLFPSPLKCTASAVLRLKKCGFGDVGFDVLGVVVFVPPKNTKIYSMILPCLDDMAFLKS